MIRVQPNEAKWRKIERKLVKKWGVIAKRVATMIFLSLNEQNLMTNVMIFNKSHYLSLH